MRFKLTSLLILFTAACFLLAAFATLLHAGPDHHYEIGISFLGSIIAAVVLVLFVVSDERRAHLAASQETDGGGD